MNVQVKTVTSSLRGCATRRAGMTYMFTDPGWFEKYPLSYFLFDPPILVENPGAWGLSPQGISYVKKNGIVHAQDWIGQQFYPNAADILEEAVNLGGSGLVPLTNQIGELTPGKSRRLLFHPAGWLYNAKVYKQNFTMYSGAYDCPIPNGPEHDYHNEINDQMCAKLHWQHVIGGTPFGGRVVQRKVGSTTYTAVEPMKDEKPQTTLALIGWLPIDELHVVEGDKEKVEKAIKLLSKISDLPIFLTNA